MFTRYDTGGGRQCDWRRRRCGAPDGVATWRWRCGACPAFGLCSRSGGTRWEGGSPRVVACQPIARTIMGVSGRLRVTVDTGTVVVCGGRGRVTSVAACDGRCADGARGRRGCGDMGGWARQLAVCFKSCTSMFTLHVRARIHTRVRARLAYKTTGRWRVIIFRISLHSSSCAGDASGTGTECDVQRQ